MTYRKPAALFAAVLLSFGALADEAAAVSLKVVDASAIATQETRFSSRVKVDATNWDLGIQPESGPVSGSPMQAHVSNSKSFWNSSTFGFSAVYDASSANGAFTWTLTDANDATLAQRTMTDIRAFGDFNAIQLWSSARQSRAQARDGEDQRIEVTDLSFGGGLSGPSIANISVTNGQEFLWLVADASLADNDWSLSGVVDFDSAGRRNPNERMKIEMKMKEVGVVPLPMAGWLLIGGLATWFGVGRVARRSA